MEKNTNVFVLTTEYHFLLAVHIIDQHFHQYRNVLIFTGERTSGVAVDELPAHMEVMTLDFVNEPAIKNLVKAKILIPSLSNLVVFTAYRALETYLLCAAGPKVQRHLVQDGANFYFTITKSVVWSRMKETIRIYRNLWRKGIFLLRPILYTKHMTACGFVDRIWVTNVEVYKAPPGYPKPVSQISLFPNENIINDLLRFFKVKRPVLDNSLVYLSSRFTQVDQIKLEIQQVKVIYQNLQPRGFFIKLHPYATNLQIESFQLAFGDAVIKDHVPAELYINQAANCNIVGVASAALFYDNTSCNYFSVIKPFQKAGIFPRHVVVWFPVHVRQVNVLTEIWKG